MKNRKKLSYILIAAALAVVFALAGLDLYERLQATEYSGATIAMGTSITVTLWNDEDAVSDIITAIGELDLMISVTVSDSEISLLNEYGTYTLTAEALDILEQSLEVCTSSGGALNVAMGELIDLWGIGNGDETVPSVEEIEEALQNIDYTEIEISSDGTVTLPEGVSINLGAVGKGAAADAALTVLENSQATGAVVSVGGTVLVWGENPDSSSWSVGIRTPETDTSDYFAILELTDTAFISTSGAYEKYFIEDGITYHHILSGETGYPVSSGLKSVTVVSDSGLLSDALSTACFCLGLDDSLTLLEKYDAQAVFVLDDNTVYVTGNLADSLTITDSDYALAEE